MTWVRFILPDSNDHEYRLAVIPKRYEKVALHVSADGGSMKFVIYEVADVQHTITGTGSQAILITLQAVES